MQDKPDDKLQIIILSNIAQCCISQELFEDALEFANKALTVDEGHVKTLFRKAKSLAQLHQYDESIEIF